MKKGMFLLIAMLTFVGLTASNNNGVNYRYNDAVTFVERGIEFNVFLNGEFQFEPLYNRSYYNHYGNRRLPVSRDHFGRVTRVGNTFINYGRFGNVVGIGNIPVTYRFGQLASVGNLIVDYDRWGYPHFRGFVRQNRFLNDGFSFNLNIGRTWIYDDPFFYGRDFRNNYRRFREDANFFYYRAIPNGRTGNRGEVIKRRKPTKTVIESNRRYLNNNNSNRNKATATKTVTRTKVVKTTTPNKSRNKAVINNNGRVNNKVNKTVKRETTKSNNTRTSRR